MYVRSGNLGRAGRLAGTNGISTLGRVRGPQGWARRKAMDFPNATVEKMIHDQFRALGDSYTYSYSDDSAASQAMYNPSGTIAMPTTAADFGLTPGGSGLPGITGSAPGALSPTEAALISQGISTAGKLGTQAIIGTPTLTYNPATGTYSATGGATIPGSLVTSSTLASILPLLLLGGAAFVVISMARR